MINRILQVGGSFLLFPYYILKVYEALLVQFEQNQKIQVSLGKIQNKLNHIQPSQNLKDFEFQSFSQWGEDGIIQFILDKIKLPASRQKFIEFGVQDFLESNCRFLMIKDNWSGLVIDGSQKHVRKIRRAFDFWKYDLTAVCQFITKENINQIFREQGLQGEIGLLSIDIDGNDYWVWESISEVTPAVVVIEYNTHFGPDLDVSIPYDPKFERAIKHHSCNYWGASISALTRLAKQKGYELIGSNSSGVNLFFVHHQYASLFNILTPQQAFVWGKFRENRDSSGQLLFGDFDTRIRGITGMPLWDFRKNEIVDF